MSSKGDFVWVKPPSALADRVEDYGFRRVQAAIHAVACFWGDSVQTQMRHGVRWQDQTGAARGGLFYAVDGFGMTQVGEVTPEAAAKRSDVSVLSGDRNHLVLAVGHTVWYGKFLETGHGGRYAIVLSTMQKNLPRLARLLRDVFR